MSNTQELSRRKFLQLSAAALTGPIILPPPASRVMFPIIAGGSGESPQTESFETRPPLEVVHDLSPAAENLYPFLSPSSRRRVYSSQRAQVVGVRNWDNTGGIPKAAAVQTAEVTAEMEAESVLARNAGSAISTGTPHYYLDSYGRVQQVFPEQIEMNGIRKNVRKVGDFAGGAEITSMQFTMYPQEHEFPEGLSMYISNTVGNTIEISLHDFFKRSGDHSAPSPFIDPPEGTDDAQSFLANIQMQSPDGLNIYLSEEFFNNYRHFWYNFQMTERVPEEIQVMSESVDQFDALGTLEGKAREKKDYSQLFADVLAVHRGEEAVAKETTFVDRAGSFVENLPEGRSASSFGIALGREQEQRLGQSTVHLEFNDGEKQQFSAADFFMLDSAKIDHANVYFQSTLYEGDNSKRFFNLNIPLAGVKAIGFESPADLEYVSHLTTVNTDALPAYLQDKKLHLEVDKYLTSGGGDDMKVSSSQMNVVCSTVHLDGIRKRQEWPYYYMEQGPAYYRKVRRSDGSVMYMQDGSWSGGEDPWGAFYSGYHPINGGLIGLEEEYLGMDFYRNKGTYWLGVPFEQHTLGVIPDTGADHHFLELNYFMGRKRYEGLEGKIVKVGYRDDVLLKPQVPSQFIGNHYLAYEMDENIQAKTYSDQHKRAVEKIIRIENELHGREFPGNDHTPVSIPGFWRSLQALVEYYRYIRGTEFQNDPRLADLIYRDFTANSRLVLRQTNYGETGYDRSEVATFFGQANEQTALQVFLDAFSQKLGIH